jgi:hypothetical protein
MSVQDFAGAFFSNADPRAYVKAMIDAANLSSKTSEGPTTIVIATSGALDRDLAVVSMKCLMRKYLGEAMLKTKPPRL